MRNRAACVLVSVMVLSGLVARADAQTLFGGAGMASVWDDETFLGRGIVLSGGVAHTLGRHLAVEAELAWARHHRDAGYLEAVGTPVAGTARLAWLFQRPESPARAFASGGLAVVHSRGTLTTRSIVPGPDGLPIEGPASRRSWSVTRPAFELGAGVAIATAGRMTIRPELRWTFTQGSSAPLSTVEPPLWNIRGGVTLEWRLRE